VGISATSGTIFWCTLLRFPRNYRCKLSAGNDNVIHDVITFDLRVLVAIDDVTAVERNYFQFGNVDYSTKST